VTVILWNAQVPNFSCGFSVQNGAMFPAVLEAVPQCRGALQGHVQGQLIGKMVLFQVPRSTDVTTGAFLKGKLKRQHRNNPEYTQENNKTHVQYCFIITIFWP
jgi:hypothetical protein